MSLPLDQYLGLRGRVQRLALDQALSNWKDQTEDRKTDVIQSNTGEMISYVYVCIYPHLSGNMMKYYLILWESCLVCNLDSLYFYIIKNYPALFCVPRPLALILVSCAEI